MNRSDIKIEGEEVAIKMRARDMNAAIMAAMLADHAPSGYTLHRVTIERPRPATWRLLRLVYRRTDRLAEAHDWRRWRAILTGVHNCAKGRTDDATARTLTTKEALV